MVGGTTHPTNLFRVQPIPKLRFRFGFDRGNRLPQIGGGEEGFLLATVEIAEIGIREAGTWLLPRVSPSGLAVRLPLPTVADRP